MLFGVQSQSQIRPSGDPYADNVVALLHMDGSDGSTTFTDQTGRGWTANGGAQLDTAQSKFGGASGGFDGVDSYISTPSQPDIYLTSGEFTVEMFLRAPSLSANASLISNLLDDFAGTGCLLRLVSDGSLLFAQLAESPNVTTGVVISTNTWHHIAVCRDSTSTRIYVDGSLEGEENQPAGTDPEGDLRIGGLYRDSSPDYFDGWIDELRITSGVARYTGSSFAVPTEPFSL